MGQFKERENCTQMIKKRNLCELNTGLFEIIVGVVTTCHTQHT